RPAARFPACSLMVQQAHAQGRGESALLPDRLRGGDPGILPPSPTPIGAGCRSAGSRKRGGFRTSGPQRSRAGPTFPIEVRAGRRFVREHYPAIYRYLLYLAGRPDLAEDLTQETFVQAWRALDRFQGRASLRTWLHRIAQREFLQMLRRQRPENSLEVAADWE